MPKKNKQFVVIGLGRFGNSVATTLYLSLIHISEPTRP